MNLEKKIKRKKNHIFTLMGRALASRPTTEAGLACLHAHRSLARASARQRRLPWQNSVAVWPPLAGNGVRVAPWQAPPLHVLAFTCPIAPSSPLASPLHQP